MKTKCLNLMNLVVFFQVFFVKVLLFHCFNKMTQTLCVFGLITLLVCLFYFIHILLLTLKMLVFNLGLKHSSGHNLVKNVPRIEKLGSFEFSMNRARRKCPKLLL